MIRKYYNLSSIIFGIIAFLLMNPSILLAATLESSNVRLNLRNETATNYSNPDSHLKLARYHFDSGNKVQAFYITEYARKMFGDEKFEPAFQKIASVKLL
jgi:hypothetical protein